MSAAHSAAAQVFVKAKKMPATGTISSRVATTPKLLLMFCQRETDMILCGRDSPSVSASTVLNLLLTLGLAHAWKLVSRGVSSAAESADL